MKLTELKAYTFLILLLLSAKTYPQELISSNRILNVQPYPQKVESLNKTIVLSNHFIPFYAIKNQEKKAANYLKFILTKIISPDIPITNQNSKNTVVGGWKINIKLVDYNESFINSQHYSIQCLPLTKEIVIASPSQLGLLYAIVTFSKFIASENNLVKINLFNVIDWPAYSRRGVSAVFTPENVDDLLNFALMNKIETVAIASRIFPWYTIDTKYGEVLKKIKKWEDRFGGPNIMQMQNIYDKKMIEISNLADIDSLKKVVELGINSGIEKLMILADDTPPFKFGEGYVLPDKNDKKQFKSMSKAHCYLMKNLNSWIKSNNYKVELYYCPPFYTYEDMNYGDMNLYKNTPWEKDAFQPLKDYLDYIGLNMPDDVYIIWCGPNVRSRKITKQDIDSWAGLLHGKVPFTWDNTIYSHFPFTSTPLFTAYQNDLPEDFYKLTAGNGMFLNGDANSEDTRVAAITANDYWWDPKNYDPQKSLNIAMENYYGKKYVKLLFDFKNTELALRKKIGERKLWYETDTLWTIVRKIRYITDKNPEYYQQNYNRLKALRAQLKNSVPEPDSKEEFVKECKQLDKKRNEILTKLSKMDRSVAERMKAVMITLPDLISIQ